MNATPPGVPMRRKMLKALSIALGAMVTSAAQHTALRAPGRLPARVGEKYMPPGQSVMVKYW